MSSVGAGGGERSRAAVVTALGVAQILSWGSSFYLLGVLAAPIVADTGWSKAVVVGGFTAALVTAGLASPRVGNAIQATGGRPVLMAASLLLAAGLAGLSFAQSLAQYYLAWIILGLGMGAGLYDAAFATLGRLYGSSARQAITTLTLFGGFASTVGWSTSAFLVETLGWRGACLAYAGMHLVVTLPLVAIMLPRAPADAGEGPRLTLADLLRGRGNTGGAVPREYRLLFLLVAAGMTSAIVAFAVISMHLLTILQARGFTLAAAVALGALVGPSQVGARLVETFFGLRFHPLWTAAFSAALTLSGVAMLAAGAPIVSLALVLYGAGLGIHSIVRGSLPLALFGPGRYAVLMGKLALPILLAGALAPLVGAWVIDTAGPDALLAGLVAICLLYAAILAAVALEARRRGPPEA
ncbi:MAG: MFS transporter [Salinarimonadaceae bacterium]|nr:MAG: MFS transporter [Salinarimonadaceae bacterium]